MMAEDLDDGEFWLPPQFLSEDDLLMDFNKKSNNNNTRSGNGGGKYFGGNNCGYEFPNGFGSYGPNSDLSSPVESVVSFTETESDEDEFSGLTWKLAQSTLSDDLWKVDSGLNYGKAKSWSMSRSPQSTLCNVMGCGRGCKQGSSHGSPNCPSPPPSAAALSNNEAAWNLLYAAAGEVAKMRMVEETAAAGVYYPNKAHLGIPRKPSPISVPLKRSPNHPNLGFHSNQSLSYHQHQANQFQQQLMMKQQTGFVSNLKAQQMAQNVRNVGNGRPLGLSPSAWPTLQQSQSQQRQPGSGMRAVFLGNPVAKRECSGTGVFLPLRVGTPIETRKKPVCSTVLIPDRIVQVLNLNLEAMETTPQFQTRSNKTNAGLSHDYDAALKYRNNLLMAQAQQRRNIARPAPVSNEVRLPQEWTY